MRMLPLIICHGDSGPWNTPQKMPPTVLFPRNLCSNPTEPPFGADETQKGKVIFPRSDRPVNGRDRTEL